MVSEESGKPHTKQFIGDRPARNSRGSGSRCGGPPTAEPFLRRHGSQRPELFTFRSIHSANANLIQHLHSIEIVEKVKRRM